MPTQRELLRTMTFSAYDLQKLRIQMGLRLCANFRNQLKQAEGEEEVEDELSEEALSVIDELKASYQRLTDGVARNRTLPARRGFVGDSLISNYTELVLVHQYLAVEKNEREQFRLLSEILEEIPIYTRFLKDIRGIGPAMAAVVVSYFDPYKAERPSDFWSFAGLDVAADGKGRSRRTEHLVERTYTNRAGDEATRLSTTYNPWLKSRLLGALGSVFLKVQGCPYRQYYDGRKHRVMTDPARLKCTLAQYKAAHKAYKKAADNKADNEAELKAEVDRLWPPLRVHRDATRVMIKTFLLDLWTKWREIEGLPIVGPYGQDKLGLPPHGKAA